MNSYLKSIFKTLPTDIQCAIVKKSDCTLELFVLGMEEHALVRQEVVANPNCPLPLLERGAVDENMIVRVRTFLNPTCPTKLLEKGAVSKDHVCNIVSHPNCSPSILTKVFNSRQSFPDLLEDLLLRIVTHPQATVELLANAFNLSSVIVKLKILSRDDCPGKLFSLGVYHSKESVRLAVASNPRCPVKLLEILSTDKQAEVRSAVAVNPNCPESLRYILLKDVVRSVRASVVKSTSSVGILAEAFFDKEYMLHRDVVLSNVESLPACVYENISAIAEEIQVLVASQSRTPKQVLEKLATSQETFIRRAVIQNPNCPIEVLQQALVDSEYDIRHLSLQTVYSRQN